MPRGMNKMKNMFKFDSCSYFYKSAQNILQGSGSGDPHYGRRGTPPGSQGPLGIQMAVGPLMMTHTHPRGWSPGHHMHSLTRGSPSPGTPSSARDPCYADLAAPGSGHPPASCPPP